jgi:energy-coupling factor transporter ATP-binding protein EcfA2
VSQDALRKTDDSRAFEATRRFDELSRFHVPFDELNGDVRTEATVARLVAKAGRVAIIGPSGSGKSSVISGVLGPLEEELPESIVPLRVPVATEHDETVTEPGAMARHIVRYVTRWASRERFSPAEQEEFESAIADVTRRAGRRKSREYHVGLPLWLANVEFARQVQSAGEDYESQQSGADAVEHLKRMLALFASHDLLAVLVFDDSDTWLRVPGLDRTEVATAFFLRTVRMIAKELEAGLVLAVHQAYLELPAYGEAREWLSGEVWIPRLIDPRRGVESILRDRLVIADVGAPIDEVMDENALLHLVKYYDDNRTIRDVLRVAQRSVQHALSDGADLITSQLVEQAIVELNERA